MLHGPNNSLRFYTHICNYHERERSKERERERERKRQRERKRF